MGDEQQDSRRSGNRVLMAAAAAVLLAVIAGGYLLVRDGDGDAAGSSDNPQFEIDGYEFVGVIGQPTIPNAPVDIAIAPDGRVYVADLGLGRVLAYTPDGELDEAWGQGGLSDQVASPAQIALDGDGNIYTLGLNTFDVTALNQDGERAGEWSAAIDDDNAPSLGGSSALAVSGDTVYILDRALGQIRRYSTSGGERDPWELPDARSIDIAASEDQLALLYSDIREHPGIQLLNADGEVTAELSPAEMPAEMGDREPSAIAVTSVGEIIVLLDPVESDSAPGFAVIDPNSGEVRITEAGDSDYPAAVNNLPAPGLAASEDGRVIIPNPARQQVEIYSQTGDLLQTLAPQTLDGRFAELDEIATGPEGNVYAVDPGLSRVIEFRPDGSVARVYDYSEGRVPGFQTGFTRQRAHLAVPATGEVYVAGGNPLSGSGSPSPIIKFDPSGEISDTGWGGAGLSDGEHAVNAMTAGPDGRVYLVIDTAANEVRVFTTDGEDRGPLIEPFWTGAIQDVVATGERVYTVELDAGSSVVRAFTREGDYLEAIAELSGSDETANRTGFALAPDGEGNLLVATSNVISGTETGPQFEYALQRLDEDGNLTKLGDLEIPFTTLPDIATAPDGTLYIATPNAHRIYVYRPAS